MFMPVLSFTDFTDVKNYTSISGKRIGIVPLLSLLQWFRKSESIDRSYGGANLFTETKR
jgi:hypothetical protein